MKRIVVGLFATMAILGLAGCSEADPATGENSSPAWLDRSASSTIDSVPEPITRSELMRRYADIAPYDQSATPSAVDELSEIICDNMDRGITIDEAIEMSTEIYGPKATEFIELVVSYKCPEYLDDFK